MANRKAPTSPRSPVLSSPPAPPAPQAPAPQEGQTGETAWTVLLRPLFWFLILPGGVLLLVKWLLEF